MTVTSTSIKAAIPDARPGPFQLPSGRTALLIIDMQRDFVQDGGYGSYQCPSRETFEKVGTTIGPIKKALAASRQAGVTVIHTREGHVPDLSDCAVTKVHRQVGINPSQHGLTIGEQGPMGRLLVRNEYGHDIIDDLKPREDELILDKPAKGSFCNTNFFDLLTASGITHLLLAGVTTECCVATTFREGNDRGFECCVLSDCTGGFNDNIVKWSIEGFCAYDGLFGYVSNSEAYIKSLTHYRASKSDYSGELSYTRLRQLYTKSPSSASEILSDLSSRASTLQVGRAPMLNLRTPLSEDLPVLYGIPFTTTLEVSRESDLVAAISSLGAVWLGQIDPSDIPRALASVCSFVVSTSSQVSDDTIFKESEEKLFRFSATPGSLETEGVDVLCPDDSITFVSREIALCRKVWTFLLNIRGIHIPTASPSPQISDYRDVPKQSWKFGVLSETALQELSEEERTTYLALLTRLKGFASGKFEDINVSSYSKAAALSNVLRNQEILATMALRGEHLEASKALPASEVLQKGRQLRTLLRKLSSNFLGAEKYIFVLPFENSAAVDTLRSLLNPLSMSSITVTPNGGKAGITFAVPQAHDYEALDLVQYLMANN